MNPDASWSLRCTRCTETFAYGPMLNGCPACRRAGVVSVLEVSFSPDTSPLMPSPSRGPTGLPRYVDLFPLEPKDWITLGEGDTPLVRSKHIGPRLGLEQLYFKNEAVNPTGSFKDRYVAFTVSTARAYGFDRLVVSSTGNLGVSVAAYGAAAGLRCLVLVLPGTSQSIIDQTRLHGAEVVTVAPQERQSVFERIARHGEWFPIGLFLARPVQNPFGIEGYRAIAYEMLEALGEAPGGVLFPCARGNGLYGAWKGFRQAQQWRWSRATPAMIACQPLGANSLQVSWEQQAAEPVELPRTESVAFSAAETIADHSALAAVRDSGGTARSARDSEILEAVSDLALEGLYVEPAAALPVACLPELVSNGIITREKACVCVLTATGMKWPLREARPRKLTHLPDDRSTISKYLSSLG